MLTTITELFERDLNKLIAEIESYKDENDIWKTRGNISNSAGNLVLHLIGNLKHFIGATLGHTGYIREREKEFSEKDIPKTQMIDELKETISVLKNTLSHLSEDELTKDFPVEIGGKILSTQYMLIHLLGHLNYHLGQVNYLRRMME